ncbi:MAG: DNA polymerase III subunit gamma/tau [Wenzhouxiangellaceae bacterium]
MSYQVLARKWRPRDFSALVGQEHVVRALSNGLDEGRLHHAFLFTGTRGVGKTTIARILAKSLNCATGVTSRPCGECENCVAIDEGRFVDLLEIDAASRTRVDDTREILDNVQYAPARGRYKVYLIDEVHMLSTHSFNALLKTLEEPPEHVKFVLATTDPQKIPVTILSRCLQFNLKRLEVDRIAGHLEFILGQEGIEHKPEATRLLARAADGSMRDALSLLDQALAAGSSRLETDLVREMLGTVEQRQLDRIVEALIEHKPADALAAVEEVFRMARDLARLLADLSELLHRVALIQQVPEYRDDSRSDWERLLDFAARIDPEDVQLYYQIAVTGRRDLNLAPSPRTGCEMTLLRMFAFRMAGADDNDYDSRAAMPGRAQAAPDSTARANGKASGVAEAPPAAAPASGPATDPAVDPASSAAADSPAVADQPAASGLSADTWPRVLAALDVNGSVRALAGMLAVGAVDDQRIEFLHTAEDRMLLSDRFKTSLARALAVHTGVERRLEFTIAGDDGALESTPAIQEQQRKQHRQTDAEQAIAQDPVIQRMRESLGAEVVPGSVRPQD